MRLEGGGEGEALELAQQVKPTLTGGRRGAATEGEGARAGGGSETGGAEVERFGWRVSCKERLVSSLAPNLAAVPTHSVAVKTQGGRSSHGRRGLPPEHGARARRKLRLAEEGELPQRRGERSAHSGASAWELYTA